MSAIPAEFSVSGLRRMFRCHSNIQTQAGLKQGSFRNSLEFNVPRFLGHRVYADSMYEFEVEQSVGVETNVPSFLIHSNLESSLTAYAGQPTQRLEEGMLVHSSHI
jgi:hypothetical protein